MTSIEVSTARTLIHSGREIAVLDIREAGQFIESHLLFAIPLPYSVLEIEIARLVPRRDVRILLIDAGDGVSLRAQKRLVSLAYTDVVTVKGGMPAWEAAGFPAYKGVNVPSKVLGELAETVWHPQMVTPDELDVLLHSDAAVSFYDVRPQNEYAKMRVPHAVCLPNGELPHRVMAVSDPAEKSTIVLTCAGRTRGIIGAVGLQVSGHNGPVAALENGTQGWALSGRALERGNNADPLPAITEADRAVSASRAQQMCARFGINELTPETLKDHLHDTGTTSFLFDLRSPDEADAAPFGDARVVPGVQLVQATDQFVGVKHATLVLACDTGLRSAIAAFWLRQIGFKVFIFVLDKWPDWPALEPISDRLPLADVQRLGVADLHANDLIIDVRRSEAYRAKHLDGAKWGVRPQLFKELSEPEYRRIVFIDAGDGRAELCAVEALDLGYRDVFIVDGGFAAFDGADHQLVSTPDEPSDSEAIDFAFFVHDRHDGNLESSRRYLEWETGLVAQLDALERAEFHLTAP